MTTAIRNEYTQMGVGNYYLQNADTYENPHSNFAINCLNQLWNPAFSTVLDLACGDGLISKHLKNSQFKGTIVGCDKYLSARYMKETGNHCHSFSFEEIANGQHDLPKVDVIVISYALDLIEKSYLNTFMFALSLISDNLIVIRPNNHKVDHFAWTVAQGSRSEKARGVLYKTVK